MRWHKADPFDMLPVVTDSPWQIVQKVAGLQTKETKSKKSKILNFVPAQGSVLVVMIKRKPEYVDENNGMPSLKRKKLSAHEASEIQSPLGLLWDGNNYSCAYDALLTVLHSIWSQNPSKWIRQFKDMNHIMNVLASGFYRASQDQGTLESARNKVRHLLHQRSPDLFPYGYAGTQSLKWQSNFSEVIM